TASACRRCASGSPRPSSWSWSPPASDEPRQYIPHDFSHRLRALPMTTLEIKGLTARVAATEDSPETVEILKGVDLTIESGQTHAIMGPNGSGKSTLAYVIAGHPKYEVTGGTVTLDGEDVLSMEVDERARAGLFLAMQYP